jgi:hypothetical protein
MPKGCSDNDEMGFLKKKKNYTKRIELAEIVSTL